MPQPAFMPTEGLTDLLARLTEQGYRLLGPVQSQGAVTFGTFTQVSQLARGWQDDTQPGRYRLVASPSPRYFDICCTAQGIKPWLFHAEELLWQADADDEGLHFHPVTPTAPPTAVIGVRACDLAALARHDQHFLSGKYPDPHYRARREALLLVAVNCHRSSQSCFCQAMGTGPAIHQGYDLLLDELESGFVVQAGSARGAKLLQDLDLAPASQDQKSAARHGQEQARRQQTRDMPAGDLQEILYQAQGQESQWLPVGERCLACGNCTAVCPTCFCFRVEQHSNLAGNQHQAVRRWDSCFSNQHSYIVGKIIRKAPEHKYRQWLTHKLATWHQQYGHGGCVGCGRCLVWCPAGIDLTEEAWRIAQACRHD